MRKICKKYILYIITFFLVVVVGFSLLYLKLKKNHDELKEINTEYNQEQERRKEVKFLNDVLSEIEEEINYFNSHFVIDSEIVGFFGEIEEIAKNVGVEAEVVSVGEPSPYQSGVTVGVDFSGDFESVYKFVLLLENSKYELKIESIRIVKETYAQEELTYTSWKGDLVLRVTSFISSEEKENEEI
jgi:Tfp pilus assembly protein PilO